MVGFDKDKVIALLLVISVAVLGAAVLADLGATFAYAVLVWIFVLVLLGAAAYGSGDRKE